MLKVFLTTFLKKFKKLWIWIILNFFNVFNLQPGSGLSELKAMSG